MYELHEVLEYRKETGKLYWKVTLSNKVIKGTLAGGVNSGAYMRVGFNNKKYNYARTCWYIFYGVWPLHYIDHIDGNPQNNKMDNLRDVSARRNQQNLKMHRKGNLVGATYYKKRDSYLSRAWLNGRSYFLGWHKTAESAHKSYKNFMGAL